MRFLHVCSRPFILWLVCFAQQFQKWWHTDPQTDTSTQAFYYRLLAQLKFQLKLQPDWVSHPPTYQAQESSETIFWKCTYILFTDNLCTWLSQNSLAVLYIHMYIYSRHDRRLVKTKTDTQTDFITLQAFNIDWWASNIEPPCSSDAHRDLHHN